MFNKLSIHLSIIIITIGMSVASNIDPNELSINYYDPDGSQATRVYLASSPEVSAYNSFSRIMHGYPTAPLILSDNLNDQVHVPFCASLNLTRRYKLPTEISDYLRGRGISACDIMYYIVAQTLPQDANAQLYLRPQFLLDLDPQLQNNHAPIEISAGLFFSDSQNATIEGVQPNQMGTFQTSSSFRNQNGHVSFDDNRLKVANLRAAQGQSVWSCIVTPSGDVVNPHLPYQCASQAIVTLHLTFNAQQATSFVLNILSQLPADPYPSLTRRTTIDGLLQLVSGMANFPPFMGQGGHLAKMQNLLGPQILNENLRIQLNYFRFCMRMVNRFDETIAGRHYVLEHREHGRGPRHGRGRGGRGHGHF